MSCILTALRIFEMYPTREVKISYNQYGEIVEVKYTNVEGKTETLRIVPKSGDTDITAYETITKSGD